MTDFTPQFASEETIIWEGTPKNGIVFRWLDLYLIPFTGIWFSGSIYWFITAIKSSLLLSIIGIPFITFGGLMFIGRFIIDSNLRARTKYIITDKRIFISTGKRFNQNRIIDIKSLKEIAITNNSNGFGTIYLGKKNKMTFDGMDWFTNNSETSSPELRLIPNVNDVHKLILKLKN